MGNPFAAIESAINCATLGVLNNATARIGGVSINGIFDDNYVDRLGMASSGPAFTCLTELPAMHQTTVMADNRRRDRERGTPSASPTRAGPAPTRWPSCSTTAPA
ncbi:MAG: hypothetical protein MUE59_03595 [Thiobacillaceae bacterium]|nr:hypothetical protein [Thiobacillaceae bacterium]